MPKQSVLIVDDQKIVVDSIRKMIPWDTLGISQVYTACSGKEAEQILREHRIDILLTDIEMPEENGLELYRRAKQLPGGGPDCIFLTSHADFAYAQEAVRLGSVDYILQPARMEDIEAAVRRALQRRIENEEYQELRRNQKLLGENIEELLDRDLDVAVRTAGQSGASCPDLSPLFQKHFGNDAGALCVLQITRWLKPAFDRKLLRLIFENILSELLQDMPAEILVGTRSRDLYVLLFHFDGRAAEKEKLLASLREFFHILQTREAFRVALYCGEPFALPCDYRPKLQELFSRQRDNTAFLERIFLPNEEKPAAFDTGLIHAERIQAGITAGNLEIVEQNLRDVLEANKEKLTLDAMKQVHLLYLRALMSAAQERQLNFSGLFEGTEEYTQFMNSYETLDGFLFWVHKTLSRYSKELHIGLDDRDRIRLVKHFISDNISHDVSRAEAAQYVGYSEEYFSRWFNARTGQTFRDYVTESKLEYARQLLVHTDFSISIIASKIGIDNFSYFSRMFRKAENMTPQEYRKKYRDGGGES